MPNEQGLYAKLREHGCPMMDDTSWRQADSGENFTSPTGIGTAASWLPCVSQLAGPVLPGTCADCVVFNRGQLASDSPH